MTGVNYFETAGIGHTRITLTEWDSALEPEMAAGSSLEIGGSMFYAQAAEGLDDAGAWGGFANDTQIYVYFSVSGTTAAAEMSITAPGWEEDLNGFYNAARTKRCPITIYKDAAGDYTQKTILLNRSQGITYQGICPIDETTVSSRTIRYNGTDDLICIDNFAYTLDDSGVLLKTANNSTELFYVKLPITYYLDYYNSASGTALGSLDIYVRGDWQNIFSYNPGVMSGHYYSYGLNHTLMPGYYRMMTAAAYRYLYLYCTGVVARDSIVAAEIVT